MSKLEKQDSPLLPHDGYERLKAYKIAEAIYDATVVFCDRFIEKRSRTHDQMVQAARSGVRNISEGSGAAATSRKSELKRSAKVPALRSRNVPTHGWQGFPRRQTVLGMQQLPQLLRNHQYRGTMI